MAPQPQSTTICNHSKSFLLDCFQFHAEFTYNIELATYQISFSDVNVHVWVFVVQKPVDNEPNWISRVERGVVDWRCIFGDLQAIGIGSSVKNEENILLSIECNNIRNNVNNAGGNSF